jgi:hypothetical protein
MPRHVPRWSCGSETSLLCGRQQRKFLRRICLSSLPRIRWRVCSTVSKSARRCSARACKRAGRRSSWERQEHRRSISSRNPSRLKRREWPPSILFQTLSRDFLKRNYRGAIRAARQPHGNRNDRKHLRFAKADIEFSMEFLWLSLPFIFPGFWCNR